MEAYLALGEKLGRYELEQQLSAVRQCQRALRRSLESAEAAYPAERKLGMGLSLSLGALLLILYL